MCHYEACGILQQSCKPCAVLALHTLEQKASQSWGHDLVATIVEWTRVSMKWYSLKWLQRLGGGHSPQTLFNFIIFVSKHGCMRTVITFTWYHVKSFRFTLHQDDATYLVCHKRIMMVCHARMMRDSRLYSSQTIPSNRFLLVYPLQKGYIFQPGVRLPEVRCHHFSWRMVGNFWNPLDLAAIKWEWTEYMAFQPYCNSLSFHLNSKFQQFPYCNSWHFAAISLNTKALKFGTRFWASKKNMSMCRSH